MNFALLITNLQAVRHDQHMLDSANASKSLGKKPGFLRRLGYYLNH